MNYEADKWRVGNVTITRIVESEGGGLPPSVIFYGLTEDRVKDIAWLHPNYAEEGGTLRLSTHAFVVESAGKRIIVDTCVGNDKQRAVEHYRNLSTPFLERLIDAGFPPDSIDFVLCTHMHIDHVGWNTCWDGSKWVPTFPNARYLLGRVEWEHCCEEGLSGGDVSPEMASMLDCAAVIADSITPVIECGLVDFVETDHAITSEVRLFPTPGHTPGHVSVNIESARTKAIITGDVIHHPVQFADPSIGATVDDNSNLAEATRRTLINEYADKDVVVLGTHFVAPSGGRIVRCNDQWRFDPCDHRASEAKVNNALAS